MVTRCEEVDPRVSWSRLAVIIKFVIFQLGVRSISGTIRD